MLEFRHIKTDDKEILNKYMPLSVKQMCDFNFGNLYCWSAKEHTEFCEKDGFLYIRSTFNGVRSYAFPWGEGDVKCALSQICEDSKEREADLSFYCVSEEQLSVLKAFFNEKLCVKEHRDYFDYIYLSEKLATLSGRKLHSKKNHVNSFVKRYNYSLEEIGQHNLEECKAFSGKWFMENESSQTLEAERQVINLAFKKYDKLGFYGCALRVDGKIIAFCLGEEMPDEETFCVHFEKADSNYRTAYAALNKLFSEKLSGKYKYINREDDAGAEGLRKAKFSYNPEYLVKKYYAKVL